MQPSQVDVGAAWAAWLDALERHGVAARGIVNPPARETDIAALERTIGQPLPDQLRALYRLCNGQMDVLALPAVPAGRFVAPLFGSFEFDMLDRAASEWTNWRDVRRQYTPAELVLNFDGAITVRAGHPVRKQYTHSGWIPFATDGGGNSLAVDLAPGAGGLAGQVIVIGPDEDERRVLAPGLVAFLRHLVERLAAGRIVIATPSPRLPQAIFFDIE